MQNREVELILKTVLSSDRRLQPACVKLESLVIADQLRRGEYVLGPYTPPVTSRKLVVPEVAVLTARRQVPKVWSVIGVKS